METPGHVRVIADGAAGVDAADMLMDESEAHDASVDVWTSRLPNRFLRLFPRKQAPTGEGEGILTFSANFNFAPTQSACCLPWISEGDDFPPIDTTGTVVHIPVKYLSFTGIQAPHKSEALVLYKRTEVQELWETIKRETVDNTSLLSIVGAPGAGKSSAALAFACSKLVNRSEWIIVWLHFVPRGDGFRCVKWDGNTKLTTKYAERVTKPNEGYDALNEALFGIAPSESRGVLVFFDGWVDDAPTCVSSFSALKSWSWEDPTRRRLVCVTPMGGITSSNRSSKIARRVSTRDCTEDGEEILFQLASWTRTDYYDAVQHDEVFGSVVSAMWPPLTVADQDAGLSADGVTSIARRKELVDLKYGLAGGSVRLMFTLTPRRVVEELEQALSAVGSVSGLTSGSQSLSGGIPDELLVRYDETM